MKCPICNDEFYGNLKKKGIVYRKRYVSELKGDIWVCNKCYRKHQEHYLIDKIKDLDPAEIYEKPIAKEGHGVGGWLLLFILQCIIISPLLSGWNLFSAYSNYSNLSPEIANIVNIDAASTIALVALGIYTGFSLSVLKPNAIKLAKRYLWSFLAYFLIVIFLPLLYSWPPKVWSIWAQAILPKTIGAIIWNVIWLAYFYKSIRVKETYLVRDETSDI